MDDAVVHWSSCHLSLVHNYLSNTYQMREQPRMDLFLLSMRYGKPQSSPILGVIKASKLRSLSDDIRDVFMVPRFNAFDETPNHHIKKRHQLVEGFISFLLQLLYHKTDVMILDLYKNRIEYLEKELGSFLAIYGGILMVGDEGHEDVRNLLAGIEEVADEAGSLVQSMLFSIDGAFEENLDEGLFLVLDNIHILKANIVRFLNRVSSASSISAYMITPRTSVMKSYLIISSLISDLENLMDLEDNLIADVKDQIKTLHQGLNLLQSSIKNDRGLPQHLVIGELKEPLMRIGDLASEAEYLIISFIIGEAPLWYVINRLTDINQKIQFISTKDALESINKYKLGGMEIEKHFSAHDDRSLQAKKNMEVDDITVGLGIKETHVLDQLLKETKCLQVISILGMPGLGKTTLAKKLYIHPSVTDWFDRRSWCVVSQVYQRKSTMTSILIQIASHQLKKEIILKMEEETLVEYIYKTLKGRRYLIVIDDIWDSNVWDDLRRCFPDDGNGSRIMFTTRNKDIAPDSIIYALPSLSNNQSWRLLKKKVFDNEACPRELIRIGKKIAANCGGLPLAIVAIAGILSTKDKVKSTWEEVDKNLLSFILDGGDNTVMQILELSYKNLPEYLKPCFLYLGAFEEDKEIPTGDLIRLWIAEGFVQKAVGKTSENVAEEYMKELIDKSLVMAAKRRSDGGVKTCVVHDLLHDLCLKRLKEENFLIYADSVKRKNFFEGEYFFTYEKGPGLLALEEYVTWEYFQCICPFTFIKYPISRRFYFRRLRLPRALHSSNLDAHVIGTKYLVCLRYLVVRNLPEEIGTLVNLEYLLVDTPMRVELTPEILKMNKLRYLHSLRSEAIYGRDCINCSQTNKLEFLCCVVIEEPKEEDMLKLSPHLRKLKLSTSRHVDLSFLTQLETLNVKLRGFGIAQISFPSSLKKLTLCGDFRMCGENMSKIGRLEKLEVLKLESCEFEEEERWDTRDDEFQELTFLKLDRVKLSQWNVDSSQHFPRLRRLILRNCYKLEEIPCEIGEIATLETIEVQGPYWQKPFMESAKSIQQQHLDMGNEECRVIISAEKVWSRQLLNQTAHNEYHQYSLFWGGRLEQDQSIDKGLIREMEPS